MRINRKKANPIGDHRDATQQSDDRCAADSTAVHIKQITSIYKYVISKVPYIMLLSLLT